MIEQTFDGKGARDRYVQFSFCHTMTKERLNVSTESIVRSQLLQEVIGESSGMLTVVEEFWIPITHERADLVFIQDGFQAFEIKTECDSLKRLSRQVQAYNRTFDKCTAVVAARHVDQTCRMVPEWWGVWVIPPEQSMPFYKVRAPRHNKFVDPEILVRLLWREEVKVAITELGHPPSPNMGRLLMWEALLEHTSLDELKCIVENFIQRRDPDNARISTRRFSKIVERRQLLSNDTKMM